MDAVQSGLIDVSKYTRLAVQRQARDLLRPPSGFEYKPEHGDKVVKFIERLSHIKGADFVGKKLVMEDWQCFLLDTGFSWVDERGRRRFRTFYIEVPRKNAKSTLTAGVSLYMLCEDGEPGAEVYSAATERKQASIIFNIAKAMLKRDRRLADRYGMRVQEHKIIMPDGSVIEPLSREQGGNLDGLNVHGGMIDELHAHKSRDMYSAIETGMGARTNPMLWSITTAGNNQAGVCYEQREIVIQMLEGKVERERLFGIIYTVDDEDRWAERKEWMRANPNFNVSVFENQFTELVEDARVKPARQNFFKMKHLDIWTNAAVGWFNMELWKRQRDSDLDWKDFEGLPVWIGIDLAAHIDVVAICYIWKIDGHYFTKQRYYLPQLTVQESEIAQYENWVHEGWIKMTPGARTDFDEVERQLKRDNVTYRIESIGHDSQQAQSTANKLDAIGINVVEFNKRVGNFSEPMKMLEGLVAEGEFWHDGNPVTTWMLGNVITYVDDNEQVFAKKDKNNALVKIDGADAMITAVALSEEESSYMEGTGVHVL